MKQCPTCRARYSGGDSCHRCQTDLRQVLAIERAARYQQQQARTALQHGWVDKAQEHAQNACELHRTPASLEVLAMAALANRHFPTALALWRECQRHRAAESTTSSRPGAKDSATGEIVEAAPSRPDAKDSAMGEIVEE